MTKLARISIFVLAFCALTLSSHVHAQTEQEKSDAYQQAFDAGIKAISGDKKDKNLVLGIRAFKVCIRLYPERPTPYYNLACAYSLANQVDQSLAALEESLKRGFSSFELVGRDVDLINLRKDKRFKKLISKYQSQFNDKLIGFFYKPEVIKSPVPLFIFLHGPRQNTKMYEDKMIDLANRLGIAVMLPRGDSRAQQAGYTWGQGGETVVMNLLRKHLSDPEIDKKRIIIGGFSSGSYQAFEVALENPKLFAGVFNIAPIYNRQAFAEKVKGAKAADQKLFMLVGDKDPLMNTTLQARNDFFESGVPTVLQRFKGTHEMPKDFTRPLQEAILFITKNKDPAKGRAKAF